MSGIACTILGPVKVYERWVLDDESDEGEWCDGDGSRVRVRMVGDDHIYEVDSDDCTPLEEHEWCDGCGQIGCGHGSARET